LGDLWTNQKFVLKGLDHFSKEELQKFWDGWNPKKDEPKILGIGLSTSLLCNLRCIYCYAGEKKPYKDELTLTEQKNIVTQAKNLGAKTVIICGDGEPLMDKNLLHIVEHANKNEMISVVVTNGIILGDNNLAIKIHGFNSKNVASFLYNHNASLVIKMDSIDQARYDQIVGVIGTYHKFMKAVDNILDAGFTEIPNISTKEGYILTRAAFSAVVMKHTIHELPEMKKFANDRGAQFICKLPSLVGSALDNLEFMFQANQYEEIWKYLGRYTAKRETLMVDNQRCMAWHYGPVIGIRGDVRECYTSPGSPDKKIGNIRESSLRDLLKRRNELYDFTATDSCPIKTRIIKNFKLKI